MGDPAEFVQILMDFGAKLTLENVGGRTALDEALLQMGQNVQTYRLIRPIGPKSLTRTIELLRSRLAFGCAGTTGEFSWSEFLS
ncbi:MAG TPA: hypothetical protein VL967_10935 [Terracidiphilus sp.]|nr:hypothetical protein [Terracidiphilus sp.]